MSKKQGRRQVPLLVLPLVGSFLVLAVVYIRAGMFPFGSKTLVWGDYASQVVPFLEQLKQVLRGQAGGSYSLLNASGMNFTGILSYFLASPFSLLVAFVPDGYMNEFANLLVMLKTMTAAATATVFFANRYAPFAVDKYTAGVLGLMYAFGGYTFLYYQNNVWLDAMYLLPLLALALLYLQQEGRIAPFGLALAAMVVCQFQLAYMVVMALLVLGVLYVVFYAKRLEGALFAARLFYGAVLALLLSAAVWLPSLLQYTKSARTTGFVEGFMWVGLRADYKTNGPIVLCTSAILAAAAWLLWQKCWREKKIRLTGIAFLLLCVPLVVEPVNRMWHGGTYQSFPSRYGFITLFVGLVLVSAALSRMRQLPSPKISSVGATLTFSMAMGLLSVVLLYILLAHKSEADAYVRSLWGNEDTLKWALVSALAGATAILVVFVARTRIKATRDLLLLALCCIVALQGVYNGVLYMGSPSRDSENYRLYYDIAGELDSDARVKTSRMYGEANALGSMGYASIGHYSSFTREDSLSAYKKLGYSGYWMELSGFGGTALSDYFLNIGCVVVLNDGIDPLYDPSKMVYSNERYILQAQPAGSYAMVVDSTPTALASLPEGDRFDTQDWLYWNLYKGSGHLVTRYEPSAMAGVGLQENINSLDRYTLWLANDAQPGELTYIIPVGERETLYFDCFRYISNSLEEVINYALEIVVDGVLIENQYPNPGANGLLCLGTFENTTVEISVRASRNVVCRSFGVAGVKASVVEAAMQAANTPPVEVSGSTFKAQANAYSGQLMVFSLGHDEGFAATVNGKPAEVYKVLDGYMAVMLEGGANEVVLRYTPPGLKPGLLLSAMGLALLVALLLLRRRRGAAKPPSDIEVAAAKKLRIVFIVVGVAVFLVLYILPLGMWLYISPH